MLNQFLTLTLYDAKIQDDEARLLDISAEKNLKQKYSANITGKIHAKYGAEEELINNEIQAKRKEYKGTDEAEAKNAILDEIDDLKEELKELQDKEDKEVSDQEQIATDYQTQLDARQSTIEVDLEATREDRQAIKEGLEQSVEDSFSYFQN